MAAAPSTPTKPSSAPSIIQSTPHSRTSANATTIDTAPVASLQSELKKTMADEFGGHIWEFPPEMLAQMLSPKRLRPAYFEGLIARGHQGPLHPTLDDHICLVNDAAVASALNGIEAPSFTSLTSQSVAREAQTYETLCQFLNGCIRTIDSAYDHLAHKHPMVGEFLLKPRAERWYPQLYFHCNDHPTADSIDSAAPLKPDVVGLREEEFQPKTLPCCWGFLNASNPRIQIPLEVKSAWAELVWQAATYARALRRATLERAFRLAFGYNSAKCEFRVLIFHSGGLAASRACDLRTASGRQAVLGMLWPIFLWQDAEDAGFPSFTDGHRLALYGDGDGTDYVAHRVAILSHALSCRGRGTLVLKAQLGPSTHIATQAAPFTGLLPDTCLDRSPRPTRATTQTQTQASRDRQADRERQSHARQAMRPGQKQPGFGGKKLSSSGLGSSPQASSSQPSGPGNPHSPVPPAPAASISQIRSVKYHNEAVASCVTAEFRALGAAFDLGDGIVTFPSANSPSPTAPDGSAKSSSPTANWIIRISSPTSGPGPLNETAMASACSGLFGLPATRTWFQACFKSGRPVSSAVFEPKEHEKGTRHWDLSNNHKASPTPDSRPMIVCAMEEEGMSLERCDGPWDLCESLLHALLGWLAAYERGWLQRDPSIGNILRLRQDRVQSWGADTKSEDLAKQLGSIHLDSPASLGTRDSKRASAVINAMVGLGRPRVCKAILTDFDLSAYLKDYFRTDHNDTRSLSGTVEFMSIPLRNAFSASEPYLQSPLDDLWAFFYTAVWATLFHAHRPSAEVLAMSNQEIRWGLQVRSPSAQERDGAIREIIVVKTYHTHLPLMLRTMAPVLKDWMSVLDGMADTWMDRQHEASEAGGIALPDFNNLAYTGVLEVIRIFTKHRDDLGGGRDD